MAVVAHGSGSSADFVERAFTRPLAAAGYQLVTWDRRGTMGDGVAQFAALAEAERPTLVGGVSSGAMLAVRYVLDNDPHPLDGLLLALPPWLGAPAAVAGMSADAASQIENRGLAATLDDIEVSAVGWVAAELRRAWPAYGTRALIDELRATAQTVGPSVEDLARVTQPAGLVALAGDPFHPAAVAAQWAAAMPNAVVETIGRDAPAESVDVIGAAAVHAWQSARLLSGSQ